MINGLGVGNDQGLTEVTFGAIVNDWLTINISYFFDWLCPTMSISMFTSCCIFVHYFVWFLSSCGRNCCLNICQTGKNM